MAELQSDEASQSGPVGAVKIDLGPATGGCFMFAAVVLFIGLIIGGIVVEVALETLKTAATSLACSDIVPVSFFAKNE